MHSYTRETLIHIYYIYIFIRMYLHEQISCNFHHSRVLQSRSCLLNLIKVHLDSKYWKLFLLFTCMDEIVNYPVGNFPLVSLYNVIQPSYTHTRTSLEIYTYIYNICTYIFRLDRGAFVPFIFRCANPDMYLQPLNLIYTPYRLCTSTNRIKHFTSQIKPSSNQIKQVIVCCQKKKLRNT